MLSEPKNTIKIVNDRAYFTVRIQNSVIDNAKGVLSELKKFYDEFFERNIHDFYINTLREKNMYIVYRMSFTRTNMGLGFSGFTLPASSLSFPTIHFNKVVFPHPE